MTNEAFRDIDRRFLHVGQRVRFPLDYWGTPKYVYTILSMAWEEVEAGRSLPILKVRNGHGQEFRAISWQTEGSPRHA